MEIVGKSNKFDFEVDEAGSPLALDNGVVHEIMVLYSFSQKKPHHNIKLFYILLIN